MQVFACPLRNDSGEVLKELKASSHDLVGFFLWAFEPISTTLVIMVVLVRLLCILGISFMTK